MLVEKQSLLRVDAAGIFIWEKCCKIVTIGGCYSDCYIVVTIVFNSYDID